MQNDNSSKKKGIPSISSNAGLNDHFFVKTDLKGKIVRINTSKIKFMESNGNYVDIVTDDKTYTVHRTLKDLEETFTSPKFIRIHKSYLVNYGKIIEFNKDCVLLEDQTSLKVGPKYKDALIVILMRT